MTEVILIDDSNFDLMINEMVIKKTLQEKCIKFTDPKVGYDFIVSKLASSDEKILLFLDINMPELNGWELLDLLRNCPQNSLSKINVVMLSNSDNPSDIALSKTYNIVSNYITKPLDKEKLVSAMSRITIVN